MNPEKRTVFVKNAPGRTVNLGFGYFDFEAFRLRRYARLHPNLLLLGAQKSGTSSLAYYLSYHPEIHLSSPLKEAGFYLFEAWSQRYWRDQGRPFANPEDMLRLGMLHGFRGQRYIMDAATWYTMPETTACSDVAVRIKAGVEKAVYIVRHPLERMISAYRNFHQGEEDKGFNTVLESRPELLETSLYFKQLRQYIDSLGAENICVVIFEKLIADIPASLNKVVRFLGLEDILPMTDYPVLNAARSTSRPLYSMENFERLRERLRPDVEQLGDFIGEPLNWEFSPSKWVRTASR